MRLKGSYTLEVRDREGRLLKRVRRPSRSYVRSIVDIWACQWGNQSAVTSPDTGNTSRTLGINSAGPRMSGPNDDSTYGPVVGTGTNAVAIGDYALQTQVAHGTGAGQLDYEVTTYQNLQTSGSTRKFELRRLFVNQSGASITVNECGIYAQFEDSGAVVRYFCAVRDLVSPGVAVPNGGSATLTYTIGVTA